MMNKIFAILILIQTSIPIILMGQGAVLDDRKCADRVLDAMQNTGENDWIPVYLLLSDRLDIQLLKADLDGRNAPLEERVSTVIMGLKQQADRTQGDLLNWLGDVQASEVRQRWIANVIFADLQPAMIAEASQRADVAWIGLNAPLMPETHEVEQVPALPPDGAEPGLKTINAHKLWALGYSGYGRRSFTSDTGVDPNHPALAGKYLGAYVPPEQAWYQYNSGNVRPFDCGYHGTHVTGTILGLDRAAHDTIGVAFNAMWMGGPTLCGVGTADNVEAFEWCLDPDGDPLTIDDMPDVVNNSWYDPGLAGNDCQSMYTDVLTALEAAGVAVVFSAGNEGPSESTITPPKNINVGLVNTFAVAALNGNNSIAGFSSNGPSICPGSGSLKIKPEVAAPGVNVRSCLPDGEYGLLSGTSMAAPHAAGALLLLKEAFPYLTGETLKLALYLTCTDLGPEGEDNTFGMGLIDVYAAYEYLVDQGNLPVLPNFQRDLLPISLNLPAVNCDNAWAPELTVRNEGTVPVAGFEATLTIDLGQANPLVVTVTHQDTVYSGQTSTVFFNELTGLPAGRHPVIAEVIPADGFSDDRPLNDRIYSRVLISNQQTADAAWASVSSLSACAGHRAVLTSQYDGLGVVRWYDAPVEGELQGEGPVLVTRPLDSSATYYSEIAWSGGGVTEFVPEAAIVPTSLDKGMVIDPKTDLTVVGCKVYAPEKTGCVVQVRELNTDELIDQQSFLLEPGENFLDFGIESEAGKPLVFIHKFGKPLYYMDQNPSFPYEYGQYYSIPYGYDSGELVTDAYYFFYDWEIAFEETCGRNAVEVRVEPSSEDLPIADFTLSDTVLYLDEGATLQASSQSEGAFGYIWRFGDGATSEYAESQHTYQQAGSYQVSLQVTGINGCTDAAFKVVRVLSQRPIVTAVSTPLADRSANWYFFPNPAPSEITVISEGAARGVAYTLIDASGNICRHWPVASVSGDGIVLNLGDVPPGFYFLRRTDASGQRSTKRLSIVR